MENCGDAGLSGESGFAVGCCDGDGDHAEAVEATGEVCASEGDLGFGIGRDDAGAIDDDKMVWGDGFDDRGGLGDGGRGKQGG